MTLKDSNFTFLDTAYVNALVNTRDKCHKIAVLWQERMAKERRPLLSTEFVFNKQVSGRYYERIHKSDGRIF